MSDEDFQRYRERAAESESPFPQGSLGMHVIGMQAARITELEAEKTTLVVENECLSRSLASVTGQLEAERDRALEVARQTQEAADVELVAARARITELEADVQKLTIDLREAREAIRCGVMPPNGRDTQECHLIWWPDELPIPQFHGEPGERLLVTSIPRETPSDAEAFPAQALRFSR